jgi:hypothetical protein
MRFPRFPLAGTLLVSAITIGCNVERPEGPADVSIPLAQVEAARTTSICHTGDSGPRLLNVAEPALTGHRRHGDYVAGLVVDGATAGDGIHFSRITDALAEARAGRLERGEIETASCRITITVAAGSRPATTVVPAGDGFEQLPLVIDVPDLTVRGALVMEEDERGRATGTSAEATTIIPSPALGFLVPGCSSVQLCAVGSIFIVNGHPTGSKGHGAVIEGFAFRSGRAANDPDAAGWGVVAMRVNDLIVRGNRFEGGFSSAADLRASSGIVQRNHVAGVGASCDFCLAGPGTYTVRDNRIVGGGIPGMLILPYSQVPVPPEVEPHPLPAAALVTASIINNEVRNHLRRPVGVALRIGAVGVDASAVAGTSNVTFTDNDLVNNTFGIIVEAAFVRPATLRRGDITLTTSGNTITGSCQADLLVTLTNSQTGLGIASGPSLLNSNYDLTLGGDIAFDDAWYSHPAGQGNTLLVNGQPIANGIRRTFDANKVCAP